MGDSDVTLTANRITSFGNQRSIFASDISTQTLIPTPPDNCLLTGPIVVEDLAVANLADCDNFIPVP